MPMVFHKKKLFADFCRTRVGFVVRGCSHMTSAKNGAVQTPPLPPLSAKVRNWSTPPPPLVRKNQKPAYPSSLLP